MVYWGVRCCAHKSSARKGIKYSQYRPLRGKDDSKSEEKEEDSQESVREEPDHSSVNDATRDYDPAVWLRAIIWRW